MALIGTGDGVTNNSRLGEIQGMEKMPRMRVHRPRISVLLVAEDMLYCIAAGAHH